MDDTLLRACQRQVLSQCDFVLRARDQLDSSLKGRDALGTWYAIQAMLIAAANLETVLWGGAARRSRKALRDSLGIDGASPLRTGLARRYFDDLDKRLEDWCRHARPHLMIDLSVGSVGIEAADIERFRRFDRKTGDLTFGPDTVNLYAICFEAERLRTAATRQVGKADWVE